MWNGEEEAIQPVLMGVMRQRGREKEGPTVVPHTGSGERLENTMEAMEK